MTSQSPAKAGDVPDAYRQAWASIQHMVFFEGASWSGRESNHAFLNLDGHRFADISSIAGLDFQDDGRATAVLDWDDDGRLDLIVKNRTAPRIRILRNSSPATGSFLRLELVGSSCNRDAIGARVILEVAGRILTQTVRAGEGYLAQSSKRLHFGLGSAPLVRRMTVIWPGGERQVFQNIPAGSRLGLVQGQKLPIRLPQRGAPAFAEAQHAPVPALSGGVTRVALAQKLPLAPWSAPNLEAAGSVNFGRLGKPVLVNLWSTTCTACRHELAAFAASTAELEEAGLQLVTLCTDVAKAGADTAAQLLQRLHVPGQALRADPEFLSVLDAVLEEVIGNGDGLPLPSSLLLDSAGRLTVLYVGPVTVEKLLADVAAMRALDPSDPFASLLTGRRARRVVRDFPGFLAGLLERGLEEKARAFEAVLAPLLSEIGR